MKADGRDGNWRDFLPLGAVVAIGVMLAVSAFAATRDYYRAQGQQQFRRNATYYSTSFKDDVARHLASLAAIRAFVSASRGVTRWEFSNYAGQVLPEHSGFRAVLWVPAIAAKNRQAYEAGLQKDGLYGLGIREPTDQGQIVAAGPSASYLPISYVEPFEGNEGLVGLDLSHIPRTAEMFAAAEHSGHTAAAPPTIHSLVAGTVGQTVLVSFPLHAPASANGADSDAPQGYVLGVLQLEAMLADALGPATAPVQAAIAYQDSGSAAPRLLSGGSGAANWSAEAAFHQAVPFAVADRHFLLLLRSVGRADPVTDLYVPLGASLLVLALTALLAQNMSATILRKRTVERAVVARTAQLSAANDSLSAEVEQRRLAEAALRIARDKAESANRAKSAFLATMSHELRTPLNAIIGFSSILADAPAGPDPRPKDYAGEILVSGRHLLDLINDILDLTQMDVAAADAHDSIDLSDGIQALVRDAAPAAAAGGVRLKAVIPGELPLFHGDSRRINKALAHLLSNAIKFTAPGGAAVITASQGSDGKLIVEVTDTGMGMPPDALKQIGEAFSQYDGRLGRRFDGVGLGLTYVAKVAELHKAAFNIVSEVGKGTRIRLIFDSHHLGSPARQLEVA